MIAEIVALTAASPQSDMFPLLVLGSLAFPFGLHAGLLIWALRRVENSTSNARRFAFAFIPLLGPCLLIRWHVPIKWDIQAVDEKPRWPLLKKVTVGFVAIVFVMSMYVLYAYVRPYDDLIRHGLVPVSSSTEWQNHLASQAPTIVDEQRHRYVLTNEEMRSLVDRLRAKGYDKQDIGNASTGYFSLSASQWPFIHIHSVILRDVDAERCPVDEVCTRYWVVRFW